MKIKKKTFFFIFPALLSGSKVLLLVFTNIELRLNFSSSSFVIRVNLFHPQQSLFLISLVFFCLGKHYFQISFISEVILHVSKITKKCCDCTPQFKRTGNCLSH